MCKTKDCCGCTESCCCRVLNELKRATSKRARKLQDQYYHPKNSCQRAITTMASSFTLLTPLLLSAYQLNSRCNMSNDANDELVWAEILDRINELTCNYPVTTYMFLMLVFAVFIISMYQSINQLIELMIKATDDFNDFYQSAMSLEDRTLNRTSIDCTNYIAISSNQDGLVDTEKAKDVIEHLTKMMSVVTIEKKWFHRGLLALVILIDFTTTLLALNRNTLQVPITNSPANFNSSTCADPKSTYPLYITGDDLCNQLSMNKSSIILSLLSTAVSILLSWYLKNPLSILNKHLDGIKVHITRILFSFSSGNNLDESKTTEHGEVPNSLPKINKLVDELKLKPPTLF